MLGMLGIWWASTCRSGSAMVITTPRMKHTSSGMPMRLRLASSTPTPSPMGSMDMSTPRVNRPMPATRSTAPNRNKISAPGVRGAMEMLSSSTMAVMGMTDDRDSFVFSINARKCIPPLL